VKRVLASFFVKDIKKQLTLYAKENNYHSKQLDFHIKGLKTYIKSHRIENYEELSPHMVKEYSDNKMKLIEDHVELIQAYKIDILEHPELSKYKLDYTLKTGQYYTHPKLIINPSSIIPIDNHDRYHTLDVLKYLVNKIKAENKIIINYFCPQQTKQLLEFVEKLYSESFDEAITIKIFNGIVPVMSVSREIQMLCEKPDEQQFYEVNAGELIAMYTEPSLGENGFDAHGKQIECETPYNTIDHALEYDKESIQTTNQDNETHFFAKIKGVVNIGTNYLSVDTQLKRTEIRQLDAPLLKADEHNSVEVVIDQFDETKDGIGEGVKLVSNAVHIMGHIGGHAIIECKNINAEGATHHSSFISAINAHIHLHKGTVRAKEVKIDTLEGGIVHGKNIDIHLASGGEIYGDIVRIHELKNHVKIYAGSQIIIDHIVGEDNLLCIDGDKVSVLQTRKNYLTEELEEARKNAKNTNDTKKEQLQQRINTLKADILKEKFNPFLAKIEIMHPVGGINLIQFNIPTQNKENSVPKEIKYRTIAGKIYQPFELIEDSDTITLLPVDVSIEK
jgi:hypothetical protein